MLSGFCPTRFGKPFCSEVLGCRYTPLTTRPCSQWRPVSNWGVFECDIAHRRSVAILCMLYKTGCNPVHPLNGALLDDMFQCGLHAVLWSHISTLMGLLAAEHRSTVGLLSPSQCPSGTIFLTPYSIVWDWRVSRAGPMLFYWPKLLYPYYSLLLFFPFSSFCL